MTIIAIEGIDGSGKTTQAKLLKKKLESHGYQVEYIRTIFMLSSMLSKLFGSKKNLTPSPRKKIIKEEYRKNTSILNIFQRIFFGIFGYFYAVLSYLIIYKRSKDKIIVCDRFFFHFFYDVYRKRAFYVIKLFPKPDVVFFMDGDLDIIYSRMNQEIDRKTQKSYFAKVIKFYNELCDEYSFIRVNANLKIEEINKIIYNHLIQKKVLNKF